MICYFSHTTICSVIITSDGGKPLGYGSDQWVETYVSQQVSLTLEQAGWFLQSDCAPSSKRPQFGMPPSSIAVRSRTASSIRISRRLSCCCSSAIAGIATGANFKIYLLRQFCSNRVEFFYNTQETQTQKRMDTNFEIWILWFLIIFWILKRRRVVPLRPMWTIMVAAKTSRVLIISYQHCGRRLIACMPTSIHVIE